MALPSSGSEIKISEIYNNQQDTSGTPSAGTNISLDSLSDSFGANASVVGDLDGNGISNQSGDRDVLTGGEDKLGHFWTANFPGNFSTIALYKGSPTSTLLSSVGNQLVEGESLGVFAVNDFHSGDDQLTFTVVKNDGSAVGGSGNSGVTGTENDNSQGEYSFANTLDINDEDNESLKVKLTDSNNAFDSNFSDAFTYRRQIAGGSLSFSTQYVDNSDDSVNDLTPSPSVSTGTLVSSSFTSGTSVTAGDGGTMTVTLADSTPDNAEGILEIANTPGVVQVAMKLFGNPVGTRNVINSVTANVDVQYNRAITNVGRTPQNVNTGGTVTVSAHSKGVNGNIFVLGYDDDNTTSNMIAQSTKNVDTRYVEDTSQTHAFTLNHSNPNSSTSREVLYPKAKYSSGAATTAVGSAIYLFPNFIYSTSGDKTVNVNGSAQTFSATLTSGYNAAMTISSDFNGTTQSGFGNNLSITPGTANGVYTITFTGTADSERTDNKTDTLTVRPTVSLVEDNSKTTADVFGQYSTGLTPTGHSATSLAFTATAVGDTIQYNWSPPADFTTSAGGGTGQAFLQGSFTGGANTQNYDFDVNVSGGGATSTDATVTIAATVLSQQALTGLTTDNQQVRRGASGDLGVNFTSTNISRADIVLCFASVTSGDEVDDLNTQLLSHPAGQILTNTKNTATAQSFDYNVPDVGVTKTGLYDVYVQDEDSTGEHAPTARTGTTYDIVIIDKAPTTPGSFTTTSGGYSGDQVIAWSASTYAANYKVYKASSEGGSYSLFSTPTSANTTITADSNNTLNFWYKVLAENDNSYVDNNGGPSTSDEQSSFNTARNFIIFPVGANTKNVIANNNQLIRTSLNNSTSTSFTFNDPTNETDAASIVSYAYSLSTNPGGATLNNSTTQNAQIVAGSSASSTGTGTVQLITTLEGGNDSDTTCTSTMNFFVKHYPKITSSTTFPNPTRKNLTGISVPSISYQGYRNNGTAMTITFRVVAYDTTNVINDNGEVTVSDSSIVDADITPVTINDLVANLGIITGTLGQGNQATLQARFNNNNTAQDPDPGFEDLDTVTVQVPETLTLYQHRNGQYSTTFAESYTSAEDAYLDTSLSANNDVTGFFATAGAPAQGEDLFVLQADGGLSVLNGNSKYYSIYQIDGVIGSVNRDVIKIASDGQITEYYDYPNVPPKAATGISTSQSATSVSMTGATSPTSQTFGGGGQSISITGKSSTHNLTISWTDNSSINDSYDVTFDGSTTNIGGTATSTTFTNVSNGSYSAATVTAINGTSSTAANSSAITVNNTGTIYIRVQVYVSNFAGTWIWATSGGYTQNITTITGTTWNRNGTDIDAPRDSSRLGSSYSANTSPTPNGGNQYQIRVQYRKNSYTGTLLHESSAFDVAMNDKLVFNQNAGALNVSIANATDFHYFGGTSVDTGEWTSIDSISAYLHVNDSSNYRTRAITLTSSFTLGGTNDVNETYYYKLLNQSGTTTSGTTGWSNQTFPNSVSDAGSFTAANHKLFFVINSMSSLTAENATSDLYTITAATHGYESDSFSLGLSVAAPAGGGSGTCLPYGTQIWMADGSWKNIENMSINDRVKSFDMGNSSDSIHEYLSYSWSERSGSVVNSDVTFIAEDYYYDHYELTTTDNEVITATYEHPIFVKRTINGEVEYRWVRIKSVDTETDELVLHDGSLIGITDKTYVQEEELFVTLNVEDVDNYFIKVDNNIYLVHNAEGKGGP